ncbi:YybH family protein [Candidatus Enterococcus ferrettii]|uniref:SnoaL-like domain-containing protein n=1 Tax=Candidatus Enterococcus ferrettii TaxID=2815324 RepID=A0ABV0EWQ3_9ENTE|nr:nuclear transport factor 2 family protein [Enterococcus sp. 665A]MBO1342441.1 nuclear transport factor 2 family protein [Enterococcus sp. 665A]
MQDKQAEEEIRKIIDECDHLIQVEKFDELVNYYTEDATLVVKPGLEAHGREQIKSAFIKIAAYFDNSMKPVEGKMVYLSGGNVVLVLAQTFLEASEAAVKNSEFGMERRATYIFQKVGDHWLCAIDNSYGTSLLET